ncbi:hypothetical protein [Dactylosporangium sp. NPDC050588]|uniref:hypothetical protein n=1 Tax=Dactylosporangium sp. NPDC050588 TaxID=3157211 RepID=UPI0033F34E6B
MDMQSHPNWCTRSACTAYGVEGDINDAFERWHRSEPLLVQTSDPTTGLVVHKFAEADGTDEHIELAAVALPVTRPWYLAEPQQGRTIVLRQEFADVLVQAVVQLA